jgi:alpha-aminoadipate carrier protein LysW
LEGEEIVINCPKCDAVLDVDEEDLDEGDALICEECGANLNVSGVSPLELAPDNGDEEDEEDLEDDEDLEEEEDEELEEEDEKEDEWK